MDAMVGLSQAVCVSVNVRPRKKYTIHVEQGIAACKNMPISVKTSRMDKKVANLDVRQSPALIAYIHIQIN